MKNMSTNSIQPNELMEIYWNYYQLHAEQRFKILEFFITIEIVLIGGFVTVLQTNYVLAFVAGLLSSIVAL